MANDSKGQPIKNDQILSIYVDGKKKAEALVGTIDRRKVLFRIDEEGNASNQYCPLDEVMSKASKVVVLKKTLKKMKSRKEY